MRKKLKNFIQLNKKEKIEILICIFIMTLFAGVIIFLAKCCNYNTNQQDENSIDINKNKKKESDSLVLWYSDENYASYFEKMALQYKKKYKINVITQYVSSINYLENINKLNKGETLENLQKPDLYLYDSEGLEASYGYGLAQENTDKETFNEENYPKTALESITYHNKMIAYPLAYDTACFLYNTKYVKDAPATFDEVNKIANDFDKSQNSDVTGIILWDISNVLLNYGFIGRYIDVGGEYGDNEEAININNDQVQSSFQYFKSFAEQNELLKNNENQIDEKDMFASGSLLFTIQNCKGIAYIAKEAEEKSVSFDICPYPNLTDELEGTSLSKTDVLVVNYMSDKKEKAKRLAKYLSYEKAEYIYDEVGLMPARTMKYDNNILKKIQNQYEKSKVLPKMMITNDLFMQLQIAINKILSGDSINDILENLSNTYVIRKK